MELCWIDESAVHPAELTELTALRARTDGFLWLDVPVWTDEAETVLRDEFGFHPMAVLGSRERNHVPRIHGYPGHLFLVVHAPEIGIGGHVHYLELDQFIGAHLLVTVHGPISPKV